MIRFLAKTFIALFSPRYNFITVPIFYRKRALVIDKRSIIQFFTVIVRDRYDLITLKEIFLDHSYDLSRLVRYSDIRNSFLNILAENKKPLIIDCGANIGLSSIYWAREFKGSKVVAIEPELETHRILSENCNKFGNIQVCKNAIGCKPGSVIVSNDSEDCRGATTSRIIGAGETGVEIVTIDQILSENEDSVPFIIKIDIEGFESDLFSENTVWTSKFPVIIIELHDWIFPTSASALNFFRSIVSQDRDILIQGENIITISNDQNMLKADNR